MANRLYRKVRIDEDVEVPKLLQVLWGDVESGGRHPLEDGPDLISDWRRQSKGEDGVTVYTRHLRTGRWLLTTHARTNNPLSVRDYLEVQGRTARLVDGQIVNTDPAMIEESE